MTFEADGVLYEIVWNGTMDRQRTCFELTGRIQRPDHVGSKHEGWKEHADKRRRPMQDKTYAKAREEVRRYER